MVSDGRPPGGFGPEDDDGEATEIRAPSFPEPFAHSPSLAPRTGSAPGSAPTITAPGGVFEPMPHGPALSALDLDRLAASAQGRQHAPSQGTQPAPLPSYPDPGEPTPLPSYPDPGEPTPLPSYLDPDPAPPHASHPSQPGDLPSHPSHPEPPDAPAHFPLPSGVPLGPPLGAPPGLSPQGIAHAPQGDTAPFPNPLALEAPVAPALKADSKLIYAVVFIGALSIVVSAGLLVRYFAGSASVATIPTAAPSTSARAVSAAAKSAADSPRAAPSATASAAPAKPEPKPDASDDGENAPSTAAEGPEAEARAALQKLGKGIEACVETHIGVLPGTSKPVPSSFRMFQKGRYHSPAFVWKTPVFHCTAFSLAKPQPFMIQWQSDRPTTTGQGVAWIDDNGDGKPDRSLSFPARLKKRNQVEVGEVVVDETIRVVKRP